jgi:6-phospho-3-hexuloisomerase
LDYQKKVKEILNEFEKVFERLNISEVEDLINEIIKANKVILIGVGREGLSTKAFAMRLMHLGIDSYWIWDETTPSIKENDLLIATSGCGEIGHIHYVVNKAKKNGARVAVITGDPQKKTPAIADIVLFLPAHVYLGTADVVPSSQLMGNLFEQTLLILFDLIIMDLKKKLKKSNRDMELRHRNLE